MRISDWSSDVCSSDLGFAVKRDPSGALMIIKSGTAVPEAEPQAATRSTSRATQSAEPEPEDLEKITVTGTRIRGGSTPSPVIIIGSERIREEGFTDLGEAIRRSEEHTSELQSLMRISYAVFCLKKKK